LQERTLIPAHVGLRAEQDSEVLFFWEVLSAALTTMKPISPQGSSRSIGSWTQHFPTASSAQPAQRELYSYRANMHKGAKKSGKALQSS
jgi:hypothetical protein